MTNRVSIPRVRVKAVKTRAYFEAATGGRRAKGWSNATPPTPAAMVSDVRPLSIRGRYSARNNARAAAAVEALVSNIVGTGIKPQPTTSNARFKADAQALWALWTDEADVAGVADFYGIQGMVARTVIEAGECFVRLRVRRPSDRMTVPLQVQVMDPDFCPVELNRELPGGARIRAGIEFDHDGRRVAYHLYRERPGEGPFASYETTRVPADEIIHVFRPLVPGQVRGVSWLAPVLLRMADLDAYDDAELNRKKTAAMFAAFVETSREMGASSLTEAVNGAGEIALAPGAILDLAPGETVKFSNPAEVGGSYEAFVRNNVREIAAGLGLEYHQISGDLTQVNYSSIRAGLIEFRRRIEAHQHHLMVFQLCRPIWRRFVELAVLAGKLRAPGFARNPAPFLVAKWIPDAPEWVDPLKDVNAKIAAVSAGFLSRAEVVSGMGYDVEQVDAEIAADQARAVRLGLNLSTNARASGQGAPASTTDEGTGDDDPAA